MALIVQKYGGTSVGTPARMRAVASHIKNTREAGHQLVIVVSAMGQSTDDLIALASEVTEGVEAEDPYGREMDMLLSTGERISMALLSMALRKIDVPAFSLTGSQSGIITDESHRNARIKMIRGDRIREGLKENKVVIVAGFQGVSQSKEITTLGRGGSDTTAVALAVNLKADVCEIYTDVDGIYTADPRLVKSAKPRLAVSIDQMLELSWSGAGVLHSRCVELARQFRVPMVIRSSLDFSQPGTKLVMSNPSSETSKMEKVIFDGVSLDESLGLLEVCLERAGALTSVIELSARLHLKCLSPVYAKNEVTLFYDRSSEEQWGKGLEKLARDGFVKSWKFRPDLAPLTVSGGRFAQDGQAILSLVDCLGKENIEIFRISANTLSLTVALARQRGHDAVKAVHANLIGA